MEEEDIDMIAIGRLILTATDSENCLTGVVLQEKNGDRNISLELNAHAGPALMVLEPVIYALGEEFIEERLPLFPGIFVKDVFEAIGHPLLNVLIADLSDEGEYSALLFVDEGEEMGVFDVPVSEALGLAVCAEIPLFVNETVFDLCRQRKLRRIRWYDLYDNSDYEILNQKTVEELRSYPTHELAIFSDKVCRKAKEEEKFYELAARVKRAMESGELKVKN